MPHPVQAADHLLLEVRPAVPRTPVVRRILVVHRPVQTQVAPELRPVHRGAFASGASDDVRREVQQIQAAERLVRRPQMEAVAPVLHREPADEAGQRLVVHVARRQEPPAERCKSVAVQSAA